MAFVRKNGSVYYGKVLDISDGGAHIELHATETLDHPNFSIGIPLLSGSPITCEKVWCHDENEHFSRYGVRFVSLTPRQKTELRKRYLLETALIPEYADLLLRKAKSPEHQKEIRSFFMIDVQRALERLIDIDHMVSEGAPDDRVMTCCTETLDDLVNAGDRLETKINDEPLMKEIKQRIRMLLGHFIYQSTVFKRGFEKPHGYPGDYKMLEIVYDNREVSRGIGKYIDRYGLDVPYARAIRLRKDTMRDILREYLNTNSTPQLRILNLASGGCRDIRELLAQPLSYGGTADLLCIDQDDAALEYSRQKLLACNNECVHVHLIKGNILRLEDLDVGPEGSFDMIYSIGIADYLQDRMLVKIFRDAYNKLKPGGRLIVAYKDKDRHKPIALNWYGDWYFIPRNEEELIKLVQEAMGKENVRVAILREPTGIIFFADITKIK